MVKLKFIVLILLSISLATFANTIKIDTNTKYHSILNSSQIYIDKTQSLTINDIVNKSNEFTNNTNERLAYGYSPNFNVWIKFTLQNISNRKINKILEYDNTLTTEVILFNSDTSMIKKDGLFNTTKERNSINPIFKINLKPFESKTYYIKASSYITTLIIKLNLWNDKDFFKKETKHQMILALFFGSMLVLAIYNLFIFFFTKDINYFYYAMYIIGIIAHQLIYVGVANIYLLSQTSIKHVTEFASILVSFPFFALALFTKNFLNTKQYPLYNKILNIFLILIPISVIIISTTSIFNQYRNTLVMLLFIFLLITTIYASYKKNKQAYIILFGWTIIVFASMLMYLSGIGVLDFYKDFPYIIEASFVTEAIIFSIALATKINKLQDDNIKANKQLILQQKNEKKKLELEVNKKTAELQLLLQELNHRVKNNMQTIVSLIRLQSRGITEEKYKDKFLVIQNRINAMSHLHEILYKQDDISHIDAQEYFDILISEVRYSYKHYIDVHADITIKLKIEHAIYCGLILNELITNSFKYAFIGKEEGSIYIILNQNSDGYYHLIIKDNGDGYDQNKIKDNSLGTILVKSLVEDQLNGQISINSNNGVNIEITWRDNE